jgi:hypothetical protein
MATPQELSQSSQSLMDQLKDGIISFSEFQSLMEPIKNDYEGQLYNFQTDVNDVYGHTISTAITTTLGVE